MVDNGIELDEQRQEEAREYARIRRVLFLVELGLGTAYILLFLITGLSAWWRDQVFAVTGNPWLAVAFFAFGFGVGYAILDAPLTYYSGFVLPHRYQLSHQSFWSWIWDHVKGGLVSGLLGLIILEVIYWLLRVSPELWWLWTSLIMLLFTVILSNLAPVLILPLFHKYVALDDEELKQRVLGLADRTGTRIKGVFTYDESRKTSTSNAALTGLGGTRRIILADTLLQSFTHDEIEVILAHELGHHVHRDLLKGIAVQSGLSLFGFWIASKVLLWGTVWLGFDGIADPAGLPLLLLALGVFGLLTMPAGNAWSRWREKMADLYALQMTRKPSAFVSGMTRLANQNLSEADPPAWVEIMLHSHPSISKRVAMAEDFSLESGNVGVVSG